MLNDRLASGRTSPTIAPQELKALLDADDPVTLLDVREPDEQADWRIPGAVNVPLARVVQGDLPDLDPERPVVTICAHGNRSLAAVEALAARGIPSRSLDGGMVAWNGIYDAVEVPHEGETTVVQLRRVGKGCLSYLLVEGGEAVVVDPTVDVETYLEAAETRDARITTVLDTHAHADHASGGRRLADRTGARYLAPAEVGVADALEGVPEGSLRVGRTPIAVLGTPGHTPGSVVFRVGTLLLTGDTLFVASVGRPDLGQEPRESVPRLHRTLREVVATLPGDLTVLPGHHEAAADLLTDAPVMAQLGNVLDGLRPLLEDEDAFLRWVREGATAEPESFEQLKAYNVGRTGALDLATVRELEAGPNRCAVGRAG